MQQSIRKRRFASKVRSLLQQGFQRMSGRQRAERSSDITNVNIRGMATDSPAELLQHVDARPSVRRIHHEMHRPVRLEHAAQGAKPHVGVCEVMENSGAHDLIEAHPQIVYSLYRDLVDLKIFQVVFFLELFRAAHTCFATVDAGNLRRGPTQRVLGCLGCSTTRDKDGLIFFIRPARPKQMKVCTTSLAILPLPLIPFQAIDRRGIRITVVEVPNLLGDIEWHRELCTQLAHRKKP